MRALALTRAPSRRNWELSTKAASVGGLFHFANVACWGPVRTSSSYQPDYEPRSRSEPLRPLPSFKAGADSLMGIRHETNPVQTEGLVKSSA
jgi:hypothetical protein